MKFSKGAEVKIFMLQRNDKNMAEYQGRDENESLVVCGSLQHCVQYILNSYNATEFELLYMPKTYGTHKLIVKAQKTKEYLITLSFCTGNIRGTWTVFAKLNPNNLSEGLEHELRKVEKEHGWNGCSVTNIISLSDL